METDQKQVQEIIEQWYKPPQGIKEFHKSDAFVRFLIGARGSAKTTGAAVEAIRHCINVPGAKVTVLRKTAVSQGETSVETFNAVYRLFGFQEVSDSSLFKMWEGGMQVRIPSKKACELYAKFLTHNPTKNDIYYWMKTVGDKYCSFITFAGLNDTLAAQNNLRGLECSMLILIEADQLTRDDFDMALACLRWKDASGRHIPNMCAIVETNPPGKKHWIPTLEKEWEDDIRNKKPTTYWFRHLKMIENAHNLPPGYVENMKKTYAHNPAMSKRMIDGEYADAYDGKPVFWAYKDDYHEAKNLAWPKGAYLVRTFDFGVYNATTWSAYFKTIHKVKDKDGNMVDEPIEHWWTMFECMLLGSDTDRQAKEALDITNLEFPFWNDRDTCSGILDFCDPSGANKTGMGIKGREHHVAILNSHGIFPGYKTKERGIATTIAICNRLLNTTDPDTSKHVFRIDTEYCPVLHNALLGQYRYPKEGEPGYGTDTAQPLKGDVVDNCDHVVDSWRYGIINCMRLANEPNEKQLPPIGDLKRKSSLNPSKNKVLYGR